ncbi:uracil-DNA glycosylase [Desulfoprunum benzoelyticum]|uniref:DNA polymerase n=1 Tax=Desulfoprunum benzoelyticum TaxID=1506996 RepID=A0A840UWR8_9BACT|nr:uracil-DNA glycosylase [Desulfoprunum benzoelyticum]MBB5347138.1 DNA polymerase [Desulfoprunum benzoelyticum]MBM9531229.1 uracil-DNA glycosylase [Desulfoprunum benzoelyticum]
MRLSEYLQQLNTLLQYHRSSGITHYPHDGGIEQFLRAGSGDQFHPPPADGGACGPKESSSRLSVSAEVKEGLTDVDAVLAALVEEVAVCRACSLSLHRSTVRVGKGGRSRVRLMIVGDWLRCGSDTGLPDSVLFGVEEDRMVARMLEAIHLPLESVYISNVIKCVVPETCQPTADHIRTCVSYLQRQVALLEPECICAMGLVAARALVNGSLPLSQLRGRLHSIVNGRGRQVPVMATYHPSFLLKNPEMKKAAWIDLQGIGRRLKLLP